MVEFDPCRLVNPPFSAFRLSASSALKLFQREYSLNYNTASCTFLLSKICRIIFATKDFFQSVMAVSSILVSPPVHARLGNISGISMSINRFDLHLHL
jgi:hypothetical protein